MKKLFSKLWKHWLRWYFGNHFVTRIEMRDRFDLTKMQAETIFQLAKDDNYIYDDYWPAGYEPYRIRIKVSKLPIPTTAVLLHASDVRRYIKACRSGAITVYGNNKLDFSVRRGKPDNVKGKKK